MPKPGTFSGCSRLKRRCASGSRCSRNQTRTSRASIPPRGSPRDPRASGRASDGRSASQTGRVVGVAARPRDRHPRAAVHAAGLRDQSEALDHRLDCGGQPAQRGQARACRVSAHRPRQRNDGRWSGRPPRGPAPSRICVGHAGLRRDPFGRRPGHGHEAPPGEWVTGRASRARSHEPAGRVVRARRRARLGAVLFRDRRRRVRRRTDRASRPPARRTRSPPSARPAAARA